MRATASSIEAEIRERLAGRDHYSSSLGVHLLRILWPTVLRSFQYSSSVSENSATKSPGVCGESRKTERLSFLRLGQTSGGCWKSAVGLALILCDTNTTWHYCKHMHVQTHLLPYVRVRDVGTCIPTTHITTYVHTYLCTYMHA